MKNLLLIIFFFTVCCLFKCHAQTPEQTVLGLASEMIDRIASVTGYGHIEGKTLVDGTIKENSTYDVNPKTGFCTIRVHPTFVKNAASTDEIAFLLSIQYAHCLYNDPHDPASEIDAWHQVYRADEYARKLFRRLGLEQLCKGEPDSRSRPSCERRINAVRGIPPTYRVDERSTG